MRFFIVCLFFCLCMIGKSYGQLTDSKTTVPEDVPEFPLSLYKNATFGAQNLYNGRLYYIYDSREEEFQFYEARKLKKGIVYYDGQQYDSIPMMYDIVRDELIILHANDYENILLQSRKVKYFSIYNHNFYQLESGAEINPDMRTGFYDKIYSGKTKILVRRTKERQEKIVDKKLIVQFPFKDFYYLYKDGKYNTVRSKKSVLALFPEHKSELRKALRTNKIKYRKERESAIVTMVTRYDELTKQ